MLKEKFLRLETKWGQKEMCKNVRNSEIRMEVSHVEYAL